MNETAKTVETSVATVVAAPARCESTGWSTADENFFRVVEGVLSCAFLAGAGALLASYDEQ
jgi:hypothetical protein